MSDDQYYYMKLAGGVGGPVTYAALAEMNEARLVKGEMVRAPGSNAWEKFSAVPKPRPKTALPTGLPAAPPADAIWIMQQGQRQGPYTINQLRSMWSAGQITTQTQYWSEGMPAWGVMAALQGQLEQNGLPSPATVRVAKSRGVYIILGIFLGLLGIHNIYAGRYGVGVAQLLITIFLSWTIIGLFVVAVWVIVELFSVATDGNGVALS
jgi:TM2 domain-containing membrane protein YozV